MWPKDVMPDTRRGDAVEIGHDDERLASGAKDHGETRADVPRSAIEVTTFPHSCAALCSTFRCEAATFRHPVGDAAMAELVRYEWPGETRKLQNVVERGVVLASGSRLEVRADPRPSTSDEEAPHPSALGPIVSPEARAAIFGDVKRYIARRALGAC